MERMESGGRLSQAVTHLGVAYLAGQVAAPGEPIEAQTRNVLKRIDELLARCGSDRSRMLMATIWLADMGDFDAMNAIWDAWIGGSGAPARATVEAKLAAAGYKVEIAVIAACGTDTRQA